MKPWQTPKNKTPSKRGKERTKRENHSPSQKKNPKVSHKGAKESLMF